MFDRINKNNLITKDMIIIQNVVVSIYKVKL